MISGKYLEAMIDGVFIAGNFAWSAESVGDVLDATTGEDDGFENEEIGVVGLHISLRGFFDIVTGQYAQVERGTEITDLALYADKGSAALFSIPSSLVTRSKLGGEVRGRMEWDADVHSKGAYTYSDPD